MPPRRSPRTRRPSLLAAAALAAAPHLVAPGEASAVPRSWVALSGNWATPGNWSTNMVPLAGDEALILHSDFTERTVTYNYTGPAISLLRVQVSGGVIGATNSIVQSANVLTTAQEFVGVSGRGAYNLSGGTNTVSVFLTVGSMSQGRGVYNLSGTGVLNAGSIIIGNQGVGTVNQSGGTLNGVQSGVYLGFASGGIGRYLLSGNGLLSTRQLNVGVDGVGVFEQSGGTARVTEFPFNLGTGTLGGGVYTLSGGTLTASAGNVSTFIGREGSGTIAHTGGTFDASSVYLAYEAGSSGTYSLGGSGAAVLNANNVTVGNGGAATFAHSAGTHNNSTGLQIGGGTGSSGTYLLSGGQLNSNGSFNSVAVGASFGGTGAGTFIQTGGVHQIQGSSASMRVGSDDGASTGRYLLSAGLLDARGNVYVGPGGTFEHSGGTHKTSKPLDVRGSYALSGSGELTFTGFSGEGGITLSDGGTFRQTGGAVSIGAQQPIPGLIAFSGNLNIGSGTLAPARYLLSGGTLGATGVVGIVGSNFDTAGGTFELTGGVLNYSGLLIVGNPDGSATGGGTFVNNGGSLAINPVTVIAGSGVSLDLEGLSVVRGGTFVNGPSAAAFNGKFTLDGGTVTGTLRNHGTFVYKAGTFAGEMVNRGTFVMSGPTFTSTATFTNDDGATIRAHGTIAAPLTNRGTVEPTGALVTTQAVTNHGVVNVPTNTSFAPAAAVSNFNRINVTGGRMLGAGSVTNQTGGVIAGGGTIGVQLVQSGGVVRADDPGLPLTITAPIVTNNPNSQIVVAANAVMDLQAPLNNSAVVSLQGTGAALNGAGIINTGTIRGAGQVANNVTNNGFVRPESGALVFTGGISNAGTVLLSGGELDAAGNTLVNTGNVLGRGTLRAGALSNAGTVTITGGVSDVFAPVANAGRVNVTGSGVANFFQSVNTAAGTINVNTNSTAVFFGPVTGINRLTGGGVKDFEAAASGGAITTVVGTTLVGPQGALTATSIRDDTLDVVGRATIAPNGTAAATSRVNVLDIDGAPGEWTGTLDLNDNDLVIDYAGLSPLPDVRSQLRSGFAGGAWNGRGITSTSAAQSSNPRAALGYAEAASLNLTSFNGEPLDATAVVVKYAAAGDANLDGTVSLQDFNRLAANFGESDRFWVQGDFNYDATVNLQDFNLLAANFGQSAAGATVTPADWAGLAAAVPEPGGAVILFCAATSIVTSGRFRRRRKCVGL